jgi:hypothetical protein
VIAGAALFVALSGTAVAQSGIIITSPDQLGPNVVTSAKIPSNEVRTGELANETVTDRDLSDPQLKIRGLANGGQLSGSDGTSVRIGQGTYRVTFDASALNAFRDDSPDSDTLLNNDCAFTATSRNRLAVMTIDGPFSATPNQVTVTAAFPNASGFFQAVDSQFDILASC